VEAPQITVKQAGKNTFFIGNAAGVPGNQSYYFSFNGFKTHVFGLYSLKCICIATHLHTVYLDWLQEVLKSNSRYA
jgi:hypothetical protein